MTLTSSTFRSFVFFALTLLSCQITVAQPNFELAGFATENGGTTGGAAGATVTATNYSQFKSYAESSTPYIILIEGTISNGPAGARVQVRSNKSVIGIGESAFLDGIGLTIGSSNNVIIRNIRISLSGTSNPGSVNGGDCMAISGTSKNIWVDHCELYSENPDTQTDIDKYDGLIDIRDQTGYITISWCYFHDHHKGFLVGAADNDLSDDRKVTYHHNYFNKVKKRVPMYRGSTGHFFNNYIVEATDATEIRAGTCVRVERNYYEPLHYSIYTPSESPGSTERIDNIEVSTASRPYPSDCVANIPYDYSSVLTENTEDVKSLVPQYAGVGVLTEDCEGVFGGSAFLDECDECVGGSTGKAACEQDCYGDWGGDAFLNDCDQCVGGNTGKGEDCVLNTEGKGNGFMISPNPTHGQIQLSESLEWKIISLTGKVLMSDKSSSIDMTDFPSGCYLLQSKSELFRVVRL